jgi:hypothetical protein
LLDVAVKKRHTPSVAEKADPAAEEAQEGPAPKPKTFTVTSVQKCYEQLGKEDVADIRKNYTKQYQECQRRLAEQTRKKQTLKAGEKKKPETGKAAPEKKEKGNEE